MKKNERKRRKRRIKKKSGNERQEEKSKLEKGKKIGKEKSKTSKDKGSIGHAFTVCIRTENQNQVSFSPFGLQEISVLFELTLGHLRYRLTDVPPQPNSPPDYVFHIDQPQCDLKARTSKRALPNGISKMTMRVGVFHRCASSPLSYTSQAISQSRTRVKLNRVFFPR